MRRSITSNKHEGSLETLISSNEIQRAMSVWRRMMAGVIGGQRVIADQRYGQCDFRLDGQPIADHASKPRRVNADGASQPQGQLPFPSCMLRGRASWPQPMHPLRPLRPLQPFVSIAAIASVVSIVRSLHCPFIVHPCPSIHCPPSHSTPSQRSLQPGRYSCAQCSCMFLPCPALHPNGPTTPTRSSLPPSLSNPLPSWPRPPFDTMDCSPPRLALCLAISHTAAHSPRPEIQVHVAFVSHYVSTLGGGALKSSSFVLAIEEGTSCMFGPRQRSKLPWSCY
jgi:hypothetical protein